MNVILCLLVIFIHVSSEPVSQLDKTSWQYAAVLIPWRLASFAVQGFLFLSGLKLMINHADGIDRKKYYLNRIKIIILPYLLWVTIYYFYFIKNGYFGFNIFDLLRYYAVGDLVSHFYYIVILVQFSILIPWLIKLCRKWDAALVLPICAVITLICSKGLPQIFAVFLPNHPFKYNDRIFTSYLIYWIAGMYAGVYHSRFCQILNKHFSSITALFVLITGAESVLVYMSFTGRASLGILEELHMLYSMCAILFLYALCLTAAKKDPLPSLIRKIDGASYLIYLIHPLIIFICNNVLFRCGVVDLSARYFIRIVVVYVLSIGLPMMWREAQKLRKRHSTTTSKK